MLMDPVIAPAPRRVRRSITPILIGVLIAMLWSALAVGLSFTRLPWTNEAWTAIPAINLATEGSMHSTVLEFQHTWLKGLDRHTYWLMPVHLLAQAGLYKLLGISLFKQRILSILSAIVLLASWFRIVDRLTGIRAAAFAVCIIIGFESNFLNGTANGRMDMMCAALGSAAIAVWLELNGKAPRFALFVAHAFVAASIFTHPCGILFAAALLVVSIGMNNWRTGLRDLAICVIPYVAGAALWGLYIAQAPADFYSQFFGNASGFAGEYSGRTRLNGLASPIRAFREEIWMRYLIPFGFGSLRSLPALANAVWLVTACAAAATALFIPTLRATRGVRILFLSGLLVFVLMALLEGMKFQQYLVHSLPFLAALAATAGGWLWMNRPNTRLLLIGALLAMTLPQLRIGHTIVLNPLRSTLGYTADYLRANRHAGESVIGPAELGYELGFKDNLRDDVRLGYYTGLRPEFIVSSGWYRQWFDAPGGDPAVHSFIERRLNQEYNLVLVRGDYRIYQRKLQ